MAHYMPMYSNVPEWLIMPMYSSVPEWLTMPVYSSVPEWLNIYVCQCDSQSLRHVIIKLRHKILLNRAVTTGWGGGEGPPEAVGAHRLQSGTSCNEVSLVLW